MFENVFKHRKYKKNKMSTNRIEFNDICSYEAIEHIIKNINPGILQIWSSPYRGIDILFRLIKCFEKVYNNMVFPIRSENLSIYNSICFDVSVPDCDEGFGAEEVEQLLNNGNSVIVLTTSFKTQKEILYDFGINKIYENPHSKMMTNAEIIIDNSETYYEISDDEIISRIEYAIEMNN